MKERLIDILLLRIIEAYKPADANLSDEERLAQAKQALFGTKQGVGRKHICPSSNALGLMSVVMTGGFSSSVFGI